MPTLVPVMIKDPGGNLLLTLNVPLEYTPARLLADLVEASDLDLVEPAGTLLRYELARTDGKTVPVHTQFFTTGLLRGESLILRQVRTGRRAPRPALQALQQARLELDEDLDYIDNRNSQKQNANNPANAYWKDALRWQVCQSYEPALQILLEKRQELIESLNNMPQQMSGGRSYPGGSNAAVLTADPAWTRNELQTLTGEIKILFRECLGQQMSIAGYEPFAKLLALPATEVFFKTDRQFRAEVMEMCTRSSYLLGRNQRYMEAREFATIAKKMDPNNEIATTLEWIAQQYLSFKSAVEPEDRLELARSIYAADDSYGNIAQDLRDVVRETREGPNRPLGARPPGQDQPFGYGGAPPYGYGGYPPGPGFVSARPPAPPRRRSLISVVYPWVLGFLVIFTLAIMCFWILTT